MLGENGRCWRAAISQMGFLVEANIVLADSLIPGFKWIKVAGLSVGDKIIVPRGLMSWIGQYHHKVNQNDTKENNIEKDIAVHNNNLSFLTSSYRPEINDQGEYSRNNIKGKKIHCVFSAILANFADMVRNAEVMAMPPTNVSQGILPAAPGANTPTTSEANNIFAPSRKKSEITSSSSLANIQNNINIKNDSVKFFIGSDVIIDE